MSDYDHPQNWDELELGHHIVYYTFWPVVIGGFGMGIAALPIYFFQLLPRVYALAFWFVGLELVCIYFATLGDYVIPSETYRKYRSGEWDNTDA